MNNFDAADRPIAGVLLDRFNYYNDDLTDRLLWASYHSIGDGMPKGPNAPDREALLSGLADAVFIPVEGETPHVTDSGKLLCRKARQVLRIPPERELDPAQALPHAVRGGTVVFLDDFIGSGDQFLSTWNHEYGTIFPRSFADAYKVNPFITIFVSLVSTSYGRQEIGAVAPQVAVCSAHTLDEDSTYRQIKPLPADPDQNLAVTIAAFLRKYSSRLRPGEAYMAQNPDFLAFGYRSRGLLFGFAHSIPDATLPIFWAPGIQNWVPLVERV